MKPRLLIICLAILAAATLNAAAGNADTARRDTLRLTLAEVISRARSSSVDAAEALNQLRSSYWAYRSYRAELLPEINFSSTLPSYRKQYNPYQNADGTYSYVRSNYLQLNGELSLQQNIWLTGGTISLNTSLDWLRQLGPGASNRFMAIPVALTLNQSVFGANAIKWDRRIEPERWDEAKASYLSATEQVALTAITYFFQLLMNRESLGIARQNLSIAEKLYEVAQVKREMGQISKNDLLQMELNCLNARSSLTDAESTFRSSQFNLCAFLGFDEGELPFIDAVVPDAVPDISVTYADALQRATVNNKLSRNIRRRQLEADYEVAKARGNLRSIDIFAQIGFTAVGQKLPEAYNPLKDNQIVEVGVKIPLLDWGRRKGQLKVARSNRDVVESQIRRERMEFDQDLYVLVERFNNQHMQLANAMRADTIAARRYQANVETYMVGAISTLDLNDSQVSKDQARTDYISRLYNYWYYFYQLRSLTLWDYERQSAIDADFDSVVK